MGLEFDVAILKPRPNHGFTADQDRVLHQLQDRQGPETLLAVAHEVIG
jgi:hypothetical protein